MELVDITFKFSKSLPQFSNNVNMPWNWCVVNVLFEKLEVGGEVIFVAVSSRSAKENNNNTFLVDFCYVFV